MIPILVSLGSNIEREYHIREGIKALKELDPNCQCSRVFEAEPVGFKGAAFYNLVVKLHTSLNLEQTLKALREIETRWGRDRGEIKFCDRTLDIDLLTYGSLVQASSPKLPRDDIYKFAFTLKPLAELCPDELIPGDSQTYLEAWNAFHKDQPLWPVTDFSLLKK